MRAKTILFALTACVASAQDATRIFHLHHIETEQDLKDFSTLVRSIADVPAVTDAASKSMSVHGPAAQIAVAEWLFTELDRQTVPDSVTQEFRVPNNSDDVVRLFFVKHAAAVADVYAVATAIRGIIEIPHIWAYSSQKAIAVRGSADQVAATEFLVHELDQPATAKRTDSRRYQMVDTRKMGFTDLQVLSLPYASTVQQLQEAATLVRTVGDIRQVFTNIEWRALVVRGTPDQVTLAAWLVGQLGQPVSADLTASPTYQYPDVDHHGETMIRVFWVKDAPTIAAFQQIVTRVRTATKIRRVFTYNASMAMAVRGTEAQLLTAAQMLQDQQVASK